MLTKTGSEVILYLVGLARKKDESISTGTVGFYLISVTTDETFFGPASKPPPPLFSLVARWLVLACLITISGLPPLPP